MFEVLCFLLCLGCVCQDDLDELVGVLHGLRISEASEEQVSGNQVMCLLAAGRSF